MKPLKMVCEHCGSTHVFLDAYAEWSVESQDWELCSTYDHAFCDSCQRDTTPKPIEYDPSKESI